MDIDLDSLALTEIIRLQTRIGEVLRRRFERQLALVFTDVVGSTVYFARFGDSAGRGLQQRHFDLLQSVLTDVGGRIANTAGDGAFTCYPTAEAAVRAISRLMAKVSEDNVLRQRPHHLLLRTGIHFGPVLTDGQLVSGDSVNLAARVAATADPGGVRITRAAFLELPSAPRLRCRPLPAVTLRGVGEPVDLLEYRWRDMALFPEAVRVEASGEVFTLPSLDVISFGRQRASEGVQANDVVINLADARLHRLVSRWHFELRRGDTGFLLRTVTDQVTEVDGVVLPKGAEVPVRVGSTVRLGRDVVLTFLTPEAEGDETAGPGTLFIRDQGPEPS